MKLNHIMQIFKFKKRKNKMIKNQKIQKFLKNKTKKKKKMMNQKYIYLYYFLN